MLIIALLPIKDFPRKKQEIYGGDTIIRPLLKIAKRAWHDISLCLL